LYTFNDPDWELKITWTQSYAIASIFKDSRNIIWLGTTKGIIDTREEKIYYYTNGAVQNIFDITEGQSNQLFYAADEMGHVTATYADKELSRITDTAYSGVKAVHVDRNGDRWIGLGEATGLRKIDGEKASYDINNCFDIEEDSNGNLWVVADDNVSAIDPSGNVTTYSLPGLENAFDLCIDKNNHVWIATKGSGVFKYIP